MRIAAALILAMFVVTFGCDSTEQPRVIYERGIVITGTVVDAAGQSPVDSVTVSHEFLSVSDST
jgi:hypothetical protein